jgi:O-antigen ligase
MATEVSDAVEASETQLIRYSRWSLMVTAACLPLYVVRWHYGPIPTTLLETLIVVTVVLYVVGRWREGMRRPISTQYDIPILLLLLAGAISVVVAKDHRGALGLYRAYFIEAVAIFYVGVDLLRRADEVRRLILALAVGSSAFALLNLYVFARALHAHAVNVGNAPNALYGDANYVAMYLDPMIALAAGLILFGGAAKWRWIGAAWLAVVGTSLLFTFSKGSYLALAALAVMAVVSAPRWRVPLLIGLVVAAIAVTQIPLVAYRLAIAYGSIAGRQEIFSATLGMLRNSPVFGVGLGGFTYQFRGTTPEVYPHDIWLTFWVELGLLGVLTFAVILFSLLWRGLRSLSQTEGFYRAALWGVVGAFVMWTVHGIVDSPYWKNDMSVEFWILAAIEVVVIRESVRYARSGSPGNQPHKT